MSPLFSSDYFFLLATPRSGSTWLQQTLNAHPDISCLNEPSSISRNRALQCLTAPFEAAALMMRRTGPLGPLNLKARMLAHLMLRYNYTPLHMERELQSTYKRLSGAKLVFSNLVKDVDFTQFFLRYQQACFILLDRASAVDAMCSLVIARNTRLWNSRRHAPHDIKPFEVSAAHAENYLFAQLMHQQMVMMFLEALNMSFISITYERLMEKKQETLASVTTFLGVAPCSEHSPLQKLVGRPYSDIIANYAALKDIESKVKRRLDWHNPDETNAAPNRKTLSNIG